MAQFFLLKIIFLLTSTLKATVYIFDALLWSTPATSYQLSYPFEMQTGSKFNVLHTENLLALLVTHEALYKKYNLSYCKTLFT